MNKVTNILLLIVAFTLTYGTVDAQKKKKKAKSSTVNRQPSAAKRKSSSAKKTKSKVSNEKPVAINFKPITVGDSTAPKEVTITSSFKPSLRSAAKINFTAATPIVDTSKLPLAYNIPSSNLFFSYQPVAIKPVALFVDTSIDWHNDAYAKLGFGNFSSPYAEAGVAFGDGRQTMFSLHGRHTSSKGKLRLQNFSKTGIDFVGTITTKNNNEISAKAYWDNSRQYRYGYNPTAFALIDTVGFEQFFNTVGIELGLQDKEPNSFGITYHPQIKASTFFDNRDGNEIGLLAKLPINKSFGKFLALDLVATADMSTFKRQLVPNTLTINNNLFYFNPTIQFKTPNLKFNVGIQPTWDNQSFWLLPNITAEAKINEEKFVVQAGWKGYVNKNSYQSLAGINPYITQPTSLLNTKVSEQYAGFKGSAGKHFTYNARISFLNMDNAALYVNDTTSAKTQEFKTVFEPVLKAIKLHGEIGFTDQEKFSFIASANYTQFTKLNTYDKAYGLLPLEINGALRWKVFKDLLVKADVFFWDGSSYQMQNLKSGKLSPAIDANIGTEFTVMPKLNVWLQLNNIFNNKYQRWNQYEVLGLQVLGGVVYHF